MRIKGFLTAVAVVMAILTVGSSAWALNYTNHVSVAPNGQGDLLIYPVYVAGQGWENRITVINTSSLSVVAKLIVRSSVYSEEVLDFLIFLSPYDMWIGTIQYGANGPEMYSTDSSALYTDISFDAPFATAETPMRVKLAKPFCDIDSNVVGYVEVIEAWSGVVSPLPTNKQLRGKAIYAAYFAATTWPTVNALAGAMDIDIPEFGMTAAAEPIVLKDYDNLDQLFTAKNTFIGEGANNNIREVEAALSKDLIAVPFVNSDEGITFPVMTFPTKLSTVSSTCVYLGSRSSRYFPGFRVPYTLRGWDNEENTTAGSPFSPARTVSLPYEVNILGISDLIFKKGWIQLDLPNPAATDNNLAGAVLNYTGAPVIPMVFDIRDGLSLKSASYVDGVVTGTAGLPLTGYQYTSAYVQTTN